PPPLPPHPLHDALPISRLGATCESCHSTAAGSTAAGDNLIPGEAACRGCHKIDRAQPTKVVAKGQGAARCDACHVDASGNGWMRSEEHTSELQSPDHLV